jgi:DNA-binding LacI/PurR family transcriptional regulator
LRGSVVGLRDVAARAGVSVKTVSNVVNDYPYVRDETRARVRRAIEELGYRPNLSARNLRKGRSGLIALAVPEIDIPYFAELARLVVEAADEHGFTVLIDQTSGVREREQKFVAGIRAQLVDGLIFTPSALGREDLVDRRDRTPLVLLGERVGDGLVDRVALNSVRAAYAATEHLVGLGRHRIAAIGAQPGAAGGVAHMRLEGYRLALGEAGIEVDSRLEAEANAFHLADGAGAMARLLALGDPPDAVFCFNDLLALGAIRTLLTRGFRVPEDIAVVGFDDVEEGRYTTPTLTTISPDKAQIARLAVSFLVSQLDSGGAEPPREAEAGFELVARESTMGRGRGGTASIAQRAGR